MIMMTLVMRILSQSKHRYASLGKISRTASVVLDELTRGEAGALRCCTEELESSTGVLG
tara:strand:+ start:7324 stop:7500 length:177 start_codon:yes stop_codon:yes gene_type:complete